MKPLVYLTILLSIYFTPSKGQVWQWAQSVVVGSCDSWNGKMVADKNGNVYITGTTYSYLPGACSLSGTPNSHQGYAVLVAKYNPAGALLWVQYATSGFNLCEGIGIAIDATENVYITGYFEDSTITFGSTVLANSSSTGSDAFIAKYNTAGQFVWAKRFGGSGNDLPSDILLDVNNNIYVAGNSRSTSFTLNSASFNNNDNTGQTSDFFVLKCNNNGVGIWARSNSTGIGNESVNSLSIDGSSVLHIAGEFSSSSVQVGNITLTNTDISGNSVDLFVGLLNSNGVWINAVSAGGPSNDFARSICVDPLNNTYITGYFHSPTIAFGTHTLATNISNFFITKLQNNLTTSWAKGASVSSFLRGNDITYQPNGNIHVAGVAHSPTITLGNNTLSTNRFISCYDPSGAEVWAVGLGAGGGQGSGTSRGLVTAVDSVGNIYACGTFTPSFFTLGPLNVQQQAGLSFFIAKFSSVVNLSEASLHTSILLSPNPFSEELTVDFQEVQTKTEISFYDVYGRQLFSNEFSGNRFKLSREGLPDGVYFLLIKNQNGRLIQTKKVIVD
jgi:hypothetical protein